jgi:rod shape determining protein RodA
MLPVVGITLPFFSYGGSSMVASYMMIGLVQSIKSHNQKYFFEREKS